MRLFVSVAIAALIAASSCIATAAPIIGSVVPDIFLPTLQNKTISISEFCNKPTILVFFTSWSKTSAEEIKSLNKLYEEYNNKNIKILGISFDKKSEELSTFIKENKIKFDIVIDKKLKSIDKFAILIIPTTLTTSKDGKISNIFIDFDQNIEKALKSFISENQTAN